MVQRQVIALPTLTAGLAVTAIFVAVVGIPVAAQGKIGLSEAQLSTWILGLYGIPGVIGLALTLRHRQPLLVTGNIFVILFVLRLGADNTWEQIVGATMVAGAVVLVLGLSGLTERLAEVLPPPVIFGVLAGAVLHFVVDVIIALGDDASLGGESIGRDGRAVIFIGMAAYLAGRRYTEPRVPAVLVGLGAAMAATILTGQVDLGSFDASLGGFVTTIPEFNLATIASATPVMVALITVQANAPSMVFLRGEGYRIPERELALTSGVGTIAASLLGPVALSLSLPVTALTAGADAGKRSERWKAAVVAGIAAIGIALLAGGASDLPFVFGLAFLEVIVGLAVLGILIRSLQAIGTAGSMLGPVLAFAIAIADVEILGLGTFFWALAVGWFIDRFVDRPAGS